MLCASCNEQIPGRAAHCPSCGAPIPEELGAAETLLAKADPDDPLLGTTIGGRFKVEHTLGAGGMGSVYLAEQLAVGRQVGSFLLGIAVRNRACDRAKKLARVVTQAIDDGSEKKAQKRTMRAYLSHQLQPCGISTSNEPAPK